MLPPTPWDDGIFLTAPFHCGRSGLVVRGASMFHMVTIRNSAMTALLVEKIVGKFGSDFQILHLHNLD
jgi:hypothetical protein